MGSVLGGVQASRVAIAEALAEKLRQEPYRLFTNDCVRKSFRLKKQAREMGIRVNVVFCLGASQASWWGRQLTIPVIHCWAEVDNARIETSRPDGSAGIWGIVPAKIRPRLALFF